MLMTPSHRMMRLVDNRDEAVMIHNSQQTRTSMNAARGMLERTSTARKFKNEMLLNKRISN